MRAAIYLRVSTEKQDEAAQEPDCERICFARDWPFVVYRERASGARGDRPMWSQLMDDARTGRIQVVVVWALDRVGRSMFGVIRDVHQLAGWGCRVVSVKDAWLDTEGPSRDLLLAIFAWVAQHEHARLKERTRAGLDRARAQGKRLGAKVQHPGLHGDGRALARARELAAVGPPRWQAIVRQLAAEGLGSYSRGAVERAVRRAP